VITEDQLEQICLEWFCECGYEYAFGPDIANHGEISADDCQAQAMVKG